MKIKLFLIGLFTLVQSSSKAQISLRPYLGLNYSGYYFPKPSDYKDYTTEMKNEWEAYIDNFHYRPLLNAGFHADIPLSDYFSLESGLRFIQKGGTYKEKTEIDDLGFIYKTELLNKTRFDVIEIPILLNYNMEIGDAYLTISGGPTVGGIVNLRQKVSMTESLDGESQTTTFDSKDDPDYRKELLSEINRFDLGANLGVRLDYYNFSFGLNYGGSFLSLEPDSQGEEFAPYFQNFQFNIGYKIELD